MASFVFYYRVNLFGIKFQICLLSFTGDLFSCHAVDNPSIDSEMELLRSYGPDVPEDVMKKLVEAFAVLRNMADQGQLTYPYSTRELVNIVKHLQVNEFL